MSWFHSTIGFLGCFLLTAIHAEAPIIDPINLQDRVLHIEQRLTGRKEVDLLAKITQLESRERELRGQIEQQAHEIELLKKSQRDMYMDLEKRIQVLEQKAVSSSGKKIVQ